jgi:hypothetical protein
MKKQAQLSLFPTGDDLPLFSGVAPRAGIEPFKAKPAPKQLPLFKIPNQIKKPASLTQPGTTGFIKS